MTTVNYARDSGHKLSVRGGRHSGPGFGTNDGGVVIDFSKMRGVRVNPNGKTARAEGGATWGDFNAATGAFGLATTGGVISTTGIAGLTLGGGIGCLTRGLGLSLDNLVSADVVTADGKMLVASETENPDLFWAIRGGGNFGVCTSLEYKLQPVKTVYWGPMFYEVSEAAKAEDLATMQISPEARLHGHRQVVHAAPHIRHSACDPNLRASGERDLDGSSTRTRRVNTTGSIASVTERRRPFRSVISARSIEVGTGAGSDALADPVQWNRSHGGRGKAGLFLIRPDRRWTNAIRKLRPPTGGQNAFSAAWQACLLRTWPWPLP